jgi:hypothetical protein
MYPTTVLPTYDYVSSFQIPEQMPQVFVKNHSNNSHIG